jgi:hypothetical protein
MSDDLLNKLGDYFVDHRIGRAFKITFEQFVQQFQIGRWEIVGLLNLWEAQNEPTSTIN